MIAMWVGIELTVYGMGLVFLLLALLWGLIALLVRLDQAESEATAEPMTATGPAAGDVAALTAGDGPAVSVEVLAAVIIACRAHRMSRRKQAAPEMRTHEPGSLPSRWVGSGRTRTEPELGARGEIRMRRYHVIVAGCEHVVDVQEVSAHQFRVVRAGTGTRRHAVWAPRTWQRR